MESRKFDMCQIYVPGNMLRKIVLLGENVLDMEFLKKVEEIRRQYGCVIAPATEFSLKRSMIRYFNEMSIPSPFVSWGDDIFQPLYKYSKDS